MENTLQGVLTVVNKDGSLYAVVFNNMKTRAQEFYSCKKMGVDDIKILLDKEKENEEVSKV